MSQTTTYRALVRALTDLRAETDRTTTTYRKALNRVAANKAKLMRHCTSTLDYLILWANAREEAGYTDTTSSDAMIAAEASK